MTLSIERVNDICRDEWAIRKGDVTRLILTQESRRRLTKDVIKSDYERVSSIRNPSTSGWIQIEDGNTDEIEVVVPQPPVTLRRSLGKDKPIHYFRPWARYGILKPPGVLDPCGDCGKARRDHVPESADFRTE